VRAGALEDARAVGGCVVGCSNRIAAPTPPENARTMLEILAKERQPP
jgi:hypothetical protein